MATIISSEQKGYFEEIIIHVDSRFPEYASKIRQFVRDCDEEIHAEMRPECFGDFEIGGHTNCLDCIHADACEVETEEYE